MSDINGAAAPASEQAALSAPAVIEQANVPETIPNPNEVKEESGAAEQEANEVQSKPEDGEEEGKPARLTRNQRLQRKAARQATMLVEYHAEIETLRKQVSQAPQSAEPKEEDYNGDYTSFLADKAAFKAAQSIQAKLDERDQRAVSEKLTLAKQEAAEDFLERAEELKTSIPDSDATFEAFLKMGGQFASHVVEELHESEKGPLLAYQLAKNPQLAHALNNMSPRDAAREIGRLEAKLSLPQPRKNTSAPPPLKPLSGGAAPSKDIAVLAKTDLTAFIKQRNAEDAAKRR